MYNSYSDSEIQSRFKTYSNIAAGRDTVTLDELTRRSGIPYNTVLRDIQRILQRGWFGDGAYINYLSKTLVIRIPDQGDMPAGAAYGASSSTGQYRYSYVPPKTTQSSGFTADEFKAAAKSAAEAIKSAAGSVKEAYSASSASKASSSSKALALPKFKNMNGGLSLLLLSCGVVSAFVAMGLLGSSIDAITWGGASYFLEGLLQTCIAGGVSAGSLMWRSAIKKRNRRARSYRLMQAGRDKLSIEELARANNVSVPVVKKDVEKMIDAGLWGKTAYLDQVSDTLYLKYDPNAIARTASAPQPTPTPAPKAEPAPRPQPEKKVDEYQQILDEIRQLNDDIVDSEVSVKISAIEGLTGKIFRIVAEKPEKKSEIRSFMSYYLPTTLKLLRSYRTFEKQGVGGENIDAAKKDIERILDTLVVGFRQQLDQLFKADALDISTDIEVLEQMMKKDGLSRSPGDFDSVCLEAE